MKEPVVSMTLDLQKSGADTVVSLKQGNTSGKIAIRLSEDGFPYEIAEDCYAVLTASKPDGNILYNHCQIQDNTICYEITEQTTAAAGRMMAEIRLYGKDDQLVTSATFRIIVNGTVYSDDRVASKDEISALTHLVSEAANARDIAAVAADAAWKSVEAGENAVSGADTAAKNANTAAGNANSAADAANQAAGSANNAAAAATTAAGNANTAAGKANTAATNASTATDEVIAAKDSFLETAGNALEEIRNIVTNGVDATAIVNSTRGEVITLNDSADRLLRGLKVFGKTEQNGTPTPEAPVPLESVGDSVNVTVCGKNILKNNIPTNGTTIQGINLQQKADGSIVVNGTATGDIYYPIGTVKLIEQKEYVLTGSDDRTAVRYGLYLNANDFTGQNWNRYAPAVFKATKTGEFSAAIHFKAGYEASNLVFYPMIRPTFITDDTYEPYKEQQTLPISTPNSLPGIPVESGGNYTDENGRHWICDEVDFEKCVYVQRIHKVTLTDSFNYALNGVGTIVVQESVPNNSSYNAKLFPENSITGWSANANALSDKFSEIIIGDGSNIGADKVRIALFIQGSRGITVSVGNNTIDNLMNILPFFIMYELAQEKHIPLSAEQLAAFAALHSNYPNTTVFNDKNAGMEVKYVADTKLYIDRKFNELAAALVSKV